MDDERPQVVDAVSVIGVLVREEHGVEPPDAGVDELLAQVPSRRMPTRRATAREAALGDRPRIEVFGTDYPTKDGSCVRDYIQVSDLADAHMVALKHLRNGGGSLTLNCGYGQGFSVLEVIDVVKAVSGVDFPVVLSPRRPGDPAAIVARADRIRAELGWRPRNDDLRQIVSQALTWERSLKTRNLV
jgi:UDP-glucose 4-epimerase